MSITKTQTDIMKLFVSRITETFSARQISISLKKPYPLVYGSIKSLVNCKILSKDARGLLWLNYKEMHPAVLYAESLRNEEFLEKNKTISLFMQDALNGIKLDFFTILIFGSACAGKQKPRDVDILLIAPDKENISETEKILDRISSNFSVSFDVNVIKSESAREMLSKRNEPNIINETLNNHILVFGGENYYRLLKYAR